MRWTLPVVVIRRSELYGTSCLPYTLDLADRGLLLLPFVYVEDIVSVVYVGCH